MARFIVVLFLILAVVLSNSPGARGEVNQAWKEARPRVILVMDGVYAAIRDFVAGTDPQEGINEDAPGVNFEILIT